MTLDPKEQLDTATFADSSLEVSRRLSLSRETPIIPGYEILEVLGTGAFGQVYRAIQQSTKQVVAVKVLFTVAEGFREEVARLSKVSDHPNIVTLVDANLDYDPPYLVTPFLQGSLQQQLPASPEKVDLERVARWFEEIAQALQFIHGRGILHCDLKPANILLGEDEQARLVDFGQSVTLLGQELRLGSFWFMPPQQARLPGPDADLPQVSWDLYALGATIYVLLTGKLPRSTDDSRESLSQLQTGQEKVDKYRELVQSTPLQAVRELNPSVDRELAAIVESCLLKDGRPEYGSASEITDDLKRRRSKRPVRARPLTPLYWLERFFARHRLSAMVGLASLAVLVIGFAFSSFEIYQARQARRALIVQQYERGLSLLKGGSASGLVWLSEACKQEPTEQYRFALQDALSTQLRIASPGLYRLPTSTAPSPSGTRAIWRNPEKAKERMQIDLTDGLSTPLSQEILRLNQDQKDSLRYRLDGVVLDPLKGSGGPSTWRIPPSDSVSPANKDAVLAMLVRPDLLLHLKRAPKGFGIYDDQERLGLSIEGTSPASASPIFSLQGDIVLGWDDGSVEIFVRKDKWARRTLDGDFRGELFCFSPKGDRIAGHDGDSAVRVWDLSGKILATYELGASANDMAFDRDGTLLVCVTRNALVQGYRIDLQRQAWSPAEMEKSASWVFVQDGGQVVTMSDEVTVWTTPDQENQSPKSLNDLSDKVARWTGWTYDENARVRTLTREEYLDRFSNR